MALLSFMIETQISSDEIINRIGEAKDSPSLTESERTSLRSVFQMIHWPIPNPLSSHPGYETLVKHSRVTNAIYVGRIVPTSGGGSKIIFGTDRILALIVYALGPALGIVLTLKLPNLGIVTILSTALFVDLLLFLGMKSRIEHYRKLINKMLDQA